MQSRVSPRWMALVLGVAFALGACGGKGEGGKPPAAAGGGAPGGAQQQPPAPVVSVVTVRAQRVTVDIDLPGRLEAHRTADVRPQVSGIVQKRLFKEGSQVKAGQALYQIEDASYVAALEAARAQLAQAQAAQAKADADLKRYKPLVAADAISRQDFDAAQAASRSAQANVKAAQAAIRAAQVNVGHARITAPISGAIGQSYVSEGMLVTAGGATRMATIQQADPMYINVTQSASDVMRLRRDIAAGRRQAIDGAIEVDVKLEDGQSYEHKGRLLFTDPTVDAETGQVTLRAEVPNPDGVLLPGLYVRVLLPQGAIDGAFVVPQQAVTRGARDTVLIVNEQGGMEPRVVNVAGQQGGNWILTGGLQEGDRVIVAGTMIAGMMGAQKVQTREWQPGEGAAAPGQGAPAGAAPAASAAPAAASAAPAASAAQ
ncbi:MAG: efflux RND transporter periplasmic adaptor subunit [Ottowia sp.]|nr:efflux RND transporter periplasmic adaptor subunit [Ottowia sp.]